MIDPYISYVNENGQEHHLKLDSLELTIKIIPIKPLHQITILENTNSNNDLKTSSLLLVERCHPIQMLFQNCMETILLRM